MVATRASNRRLSGKWIADRAGGLPWTRAGGTFAVMSDSAPRPEAQPSDGTGRLAAAVLAVAFVLNFAGRGMVEGFSAFVLPLEQAFGWPRSALTGVVATQMMVNGLSAPIAGWLFDRHGPRVVYCLGLALVGLAALIASRAESLWVLYLGAGVLVGAGAAATGMVCAASLIGRWYRARLSTAIAVAYAGSGCGVLVMVPLSQALIDTIGWRGAWLALGCGAMALVPLCAFLPWARLSRPPSAAAANAAPTPPARRNEAARAALRRALADPVYWRLTQLFFFTALAAYLVTPQVVALLIEGGFAPLFAASAYGLAGLLSTFGIIGSGWFSDRVGYRRTALLSFASTGLGLGGLIAVATTGSLVGLAVYVLCFGLAQGARGPIVSALSNRIFAGPGVATIYGTIFGMMALGAGLGAWAGGLLHDLTGAYWPVALVSAAALLVAAAPFRSGSALMVRVQALGRPR